MAVQAMGGGFPIVMLLVLAGVMLGGLALMGMLLAHKKTRLFGAFCLTACFAVGLFAFTYLIAKSGYQAQERVKQEFTQIRKLERAVHKARLQQELEKIQPQTVVPELPTEVQEAIQMADGQMVATNKFRQDQHPVTRAPSAVPSAAYVRTETRYTWDRMMLFGVLGIGLILWALMRRQDEAGNGWLQWSALALAPVLLVFLGYRKSAPEAKPYLKAPASLSEAQADAKATFVQLTEPKINLDSDSSADKSDDAIEVPKKVSKAAPDWGSRPKSDYTSDSEFTTQLIKELDVNFVHIRRTGTVRGLLECLRMEKKRVASSVRQYLEIASDGQLQGDDFPLGMSTTELYQKFVKRRHLVEEQRGAYNLYTMIGINKKDGGRELLAKTLALASGEGQSVDSDESSEEAEASASETSANQAVAQATSAEPESATDAQQTGDFRIEKKEGEVVITIQKTGEEIRLPGDSKPSEVQAAIKKLRSSGPRPKWVDNPPKRLKGVYSTVVESGPYATLDECYLDADSKLAAILARYRQGQKLHLGPNASTHRMLLPVSFVEARKRFVRDVYVETVETSVADMKKLSTLIEITPDDGAWLKETWAANQSQADRQTRMAFVGLGAGGVVGLLVVVFGLLKLDEATKGYYTKRLFFGVPAAIVAVLLLLALTA